MNLQFLTENIYVLVKIIFLQRKDFVTFVFLTNFPLNLKKENFINL